MLARARRARNSLPLPCHLHAALRRPAASRRSRSLLHLCAHPRIPSVRPSVLAAPLSPAIGRLCDKHDGQCVICDSYVRPTTLVKVCDECDFGSYHGRCVICGAPGTAQAYYCKECTQQEKDVRRCARARDAAAAAAAQTPKSRRRAYPLPPTSPTPILQRDGCPKVINLGAARTNLYYNAKKFGFAKAQ